MPKQTSTITTSAAAELAALKARAATTVERLVAAKAALTGAQARQAELLSAERFSGDALGQQNLKVMQAESVVTGLQQLAETTAAAIVAAEQAIAAERDRVEREAEGRVMDDVIAALSGAVSDYSEAAQVLCAVLAGSAGRTVYSGREFAGSVRENTSAIIARVGDIVRDLGEAKRLVLEGKSAIPRPPVPAAPQPMSPKVELQGVFVLKSLRYRRGREAVVLEKFSQGELPIALAKFAIDAGYAVEPQRGRGFRDLAANTIAGTGPVVDLDQEMTKAAQKATEAAA
jgi:hypothetical protein